MTLINSILKRKFTVEKNTKYKILQRDIIWTFRSQQSDFWIISFSGSPILICRYVGDLRKPTFVKEKKLKGKIYMSWL
jgi:hypothetical protein